MNTDQNAEDLLPDDLVWDESGHLSEVAQTLMADGESALLPPEAVAHVQACEDCMRGLGESAMLSARVSGFFGEMKAADSLAEVVPAVASSRPSTRFPWLTIAAALLVAFVGAIPSLVRAPVGVYETVRVVRELTPNVFHGAMTLLRGSPIPGVLPYLSAALLLCVGVAVARKGRISHPA